LLWREAVRIEVTSTLTQEDENRLGPSVLKLISAALDLLPVAYIVRVETTDGQVMQHLSPDAAPWDGRAGPASSDRAVVPRTIAES
jgi:hypothetical protein